MKKFPNALSPQLNPYLSGKVRLKKETLWKSLRGATLIFTF